MARALDPRADDGGIPQAEYRTQYRRRESVGRYPQLPSGGRDRRRFPDHQPEGTGAGDGGTAPDRRFFPAAAAGAGLAQGQSVPDHPQFRGGRGKAAGISDVPHASRTLEAPAIFMTSSFSNLTWINDRTDDRTHSIEPRRISVSRPFIELEHFASSGCCCVEQGRFAMMKRSALILGGLV